MMLTADLKFVQGSCRKLHHKLMLCCEALKEVNMIVVATTCALIQPNVKPWRLTFLIIIVALGTLSVQAELLSSASNPLNFVEFIFLRI